MVKSSYGGDIESVGGFTTSTAKDSRLHVKHLGVARLGRVPEGRAKHNVKLRKGLHA